MSIYVEKQTHQNYIRHPNRNRKILVSVEWLYFKFWKQITANQDYYIQ
jgi:hypothetical protein